MQVPKDGTATYVVCVRVSDERLANMLLTGRTKSRAWLVRVLALGIELTPRDHGKCAMGAEPGRMDRLIWSLRVIQCHIAVH